ncbi:MAG TPA: hypothetical protein PK207_07020 [Candidatus Aminicenantes bacterium]|nr:hypothetical protein [Candidatus Aminicenantes bacterium]HOS10801.1 hypothetical protein [Candidatus Aminicenantes bacterium]HPL13941.1 hypothetical protein [Candidatus Aminicenantes bacterium]
MNGKRRSRPRIILPAAGLILLAAAAARAGIEITAEMRKDAARLQSALDLIERNRAARAALPMRSLAFSEKELNAWVAVLIESDRDGILRELALKLFEENRVEGKAFVDAGGVSLPFGLKPRLNIFFSGRVTVLDGAAKIALDKLFFEGQPVSVVLLDAVIAAAAAMNKSGASSINDWVALPPGLRNLRSREGVLLLYY